MPTDASPSIRLDGSADLAFVDALLDDLDRLWDLAPGIADEDRLLFGLAVSEIATNIAEHSPTEARISAEVIASAGSLRAELRDTAPAARVDLSTPMPGADAESGRGLALSTSVLDELRHETTGAGNVWTLVRQLRS